MTTKYIPNNANPPKNREGPKIVRATAGRPFSANTKSPPKPSITPITKAPTGNQKGKRMWPSLSAANHLADIANIFFIGSLVLGVVSTVVIVWMASVKEGHWELARQDSEERIAALVTQGDQAKAQLGTAQADIAKADAQIAEANARAAEAEKQTLDLRAKIASRRITEEQHKILVEELSKSPGLFDIAVMGDPESALFANDILKTLKDANWTVGERELPLNEIWTGLVLFQTDDPAGGRILEALLRAKIAFSIGDDAHKRPKATIMVGNKPSLF